MGDEQRDNRYFAKHCASLGLYVFPCQNCPDNKEDQNSSPASNGVTFPQLTANRSMSGGMNGRTPCQPSIWLSPGHIVIDGDRHGGPDGVASVEQLFTEHGAILTEAPAILTPTDGKHYWHAQPNGKPLGNSDKALRDKGINIRGAGGYVIAPGAQLPDGRRYAWDKATPNIFEAVRKGTIPKLPRMVR